MNNCENCGCLISVFYDFCDPCEIEMEICKLRRKLSRKMRILSIMKDEARERSKNEAKKMDELIQALPSHGDKQQEKVGVPLPGVGSQF